uniref:(northern house mosquito) hypothetical protein n=1 Tax=Culex pipiens TaxID=7175 RepID=A0A8D8CKP8_CULPI
MLLLLFSSTLSFSTPATSASSCFWGVTLGSSTATSCCGVAATTSGTTSGSMRTGRAAWGGGSGLLIVGVVAATMTLLGPVYTNGSASVESVDSAIDFSDTVRYRSAL